MELRSTGQNVCDVRWLGLVPFDDAQDLQQDLAIKVRKGEAPPTLLLLEHPHTFTFGRRGDPRNLLWGEEEASRRGVAIRWIDRGGDVTYHGPGQLVGYPIFPLVSLQTGTGSLPVADYVGYVRKLEEALILSLAYLGLAGGQAPGLTGVWIQPDVASRCPRCDPRFLRAPAKIASIGVKVDIHGITRHGFALNVEPDMSFWEGIIACGLQGVRMICLADLLDPAPDMRTVLDQVVKAIGEVFHYRMVAQPQKV